jgi:CheY-like chemotaxis protein
MEPSILLVEDDPFLRSVTVEMLTEMGWRMLDAPDGATALEILHSDAGADIRLLVTDVMMPGMNGYALALSATSIRPGLKVLYVSGYAYDVLPHEIADDGIALLEKPYTARALDARVRLILGQPKTTTLAR